MSPTEEEGEVREIPDLSRHIPGVPLARRRQQQLAPFITLEERVAGPDEGAGGPPRASRVVSERGRVPVIDVDAFIASETAISTLTAQEVLFADHRAQIKRELGK